MHVPPSMAQALERKALGLGCGCSSVAKYFPRFDPYWKNKEPDSYKNRSDGFQIPNSKQEICLWVTIHIWKWREVKSYGVNSTRFLGATENIWAFFFFLNYCAVLQISILEFSFSILGTKQITKMRKMSTQFLDQYTPVITVRRFMDFERRYPEDKHPKVATGPWESVAP